MNVAAGTLLKGKVAMVTGGGRGLGFAIATALSEAGATVVLSSRKLDSCVAAAAHITEATGGAVHALGLHVGEWDEIEPAVDRVVADHGSLDVLVNNAGIAPLAPSLLEVSEALWDKTLEVNLKGPFRLMAVAGDRMMRQGGGSIVNISSIGAERPSPPEAMYAAAKNGLNALTRAFAQEFAPLVRVNGVMPGRFCDRHGGVLGRPVPAPGARPTPRRAAGAAGGARQHGGLPRVRRVGIHDRGTHPGRRRPNGGVLMNEADRTAALFDLSGRVALVTGASSGLGAGFARTLAAAGATVYAAARRVERLEQLAHDVAGVVPVVCDVTRAGDRAALVERAMSESGRIDVLVNNAGRPGPPTAEDDTEEVFDALLALNLTAGFHLAVTVASAVEADAGVSIVNIASVVGLVSTAPIGGASYAASKAGVIGLTRELAGQWGRRGIRVNALVPGWFDTEMTDGLFSNEKSAGWVRRNTMLGRGGREGEVDGALLFLASDASSYVTGQVLVVDGGWTAR